MMEMEQQYAEQGQQEGEEMEVSCSLENACRPCESRRVSEAKKWHFLRKMAVFSLVSGLFFCTYFRIIMERTCMLKVALLSVVCALFLFFIKS